MSRASQKLQHKKNTYIKKDDDWETPKECLEVLLKYIGENDIIYDPFYCNGRVIDEWKKLERECINDDQDAFNREHPLFDVLVSNIPFSLKKESMELAVNLGMPFALLMPIEALGSKWITPYWREKDFKIIIPDGRWAFTKKGKLQGGSWFDTCWITWGLIDGEKNIIKL